MIDSHCHLAGEEFVDDLADVVDRASRAGVDRALVILEASAADEIGRASRVSAAWTAVRYAVGVHPHRAVSFAADPAEVAATVATTISDQPATRALGEIGLDYHYEYSPADVQREVFRAQVALARSLRLPLVIHTRDAEADTFRILEDEQARDIGGVFHCFTGDRSMARRALELGFYISLSGIVTFPKALELQAVAREVPLDRLLVETDSPYLTPVPHRGTRNEPARVVLVAETVAAIKGMTVAAVDDAVSDNFIRLFKP
jgi:TatD DNase family protein